GANREIRRACAREGLRIVSLERIAYGPIALHQLPVGKHRVLSARELRQLKGAVGDTPEKGPSRAG
ncbi:MAG: pseudouridine synthase, partial [Candidatus Eremiobacteraeota bacterium]|nr:pseudouridine synthase [Candidatus Eremiobacteraeota bacterium]